MNRQFIEVRLSSSNYIMVPVDHIDDIRLQRGNVLAIQMATGYPSLAIQMATGYPSIETYEDAIKQYHEIKARLMGVDPDERTYKSVM